MCEIIPDVETWRRQNLPIAVATVIETWGSAPRGVGARMALNSEGGISGSVSGGCVEGAVVERGLEVLATGRPQLLRFGVADETAWNVGLACGGTIEIFVQRLDLDLYDRIREAVRRDQPVVRMTVIAGPEKALGREMVLLADGSAIGSIDPAWDTAALSIAKSVLGAGVARRFTPGASAQESPGEEPPQGEARRLEVFAEVISPPPTLIMVGGVHDCQGAQIPHRGCRSSAGLRQPGKVRPG